MKGKAEIINLFAPYLVIIFTSLIFIGCKKDVSPTKSDFYDFNEGGMTPDMEYVFVPSEELTKESIDHNYCVNLIVRYLDSCSISALPLNIESNFNDTDSICIVNMEIPLFSENGVPIGKGNFGLFDISIPLFNDVKVSDISFISISTPEKHTQGIISIGVSYQNSNSL